ncbi:MAG: NAD(P)-dependent oxidoreductase [Hyphomicrobiaceae bacterium]
MANILVIGATNGIGYETVCRALKNGHHVTAFARTAESLSIEALDFHPENLVKVSGDARDMSAITATLEGIDVVVHTLGLPLTPESILLPTKLFSDSTRTLLDAMKANGRTRLIAVTGIGAGDARDHLGPVYGLAFSLALKRIYDDKDIQEQMIRASTLDWTIVRPGILTDGNATQTYQVLTDPKTWKAGQISRKDVADFIVREFEAANYVKQTPVLIGTG